MDLIDLAKALQEGRASSSELLEQSYKRADASKNLNAFISHNKDQATSIAKQLDGKQDGTNPLNGIPVAHKDVFVTKDSLTTCGSKILEKFESNYESHVTSKLNDAGMVCMGKANMDEFAMGNTGENSFFGATKNPWNLEHVPGGSSSGSAAAVASRIVLAATGTDTGGSVRMPAAYNGICGIKPTYGLASRRGMVAYASSLDQAGVLATSARDLRAVLSTIVGHDQMDSTSRTDAKLANTNTGDNKNIRIGIAKEFFAGATEPKVADSVHAAVTQLEKQGATITEVSIPHLEHAISAYYIIACAEASSNLSRYDGLLYGTRATGDDLEQTIRQSRSQGFGAEVQRRILLGTFVLSHGYIDAYYRQAQRVRKLLINDFKNAFSSVDLIATPAAPTTAPKLGAIAADPLLMYSQDICTCPVNLAGLPAIAFPCGKVNDLPVGMQLIGSELSEDLMLSVTENFQQETSFHQDLPPGIEDWS